MPNSNTKITVKRTNKTINNVKTEPLEYGEPLFLEASNGKNKYLAFGNDVNSKTVENATFFDGITDTSLLGKTVYANENNQAITQNGDYVSVSKLSPNKISTVSTGNEKYYLLSCMNTPNGDGSENVYIHSLGTALYIGANGVINGGAWNDYAERRKCVNGLPGQVVCETGHGTLATSQFKLQPLPYVISDTCGMILGDADETTKPVALSGRVLVYIAGDVVVGDVVCAGKNGFAEKMTRQEIINYPDRILGIVSEIPDYDTWNDIKINGRIWINIK